MIIFGVLSNFDKNPSIRNSIPSVQMVGKIGDIKPPLGLKV
jgi:hypothetical protein